MWMVPQEVYARGVITQGGDVAWAFGDTMEILRHLEGARGFLVLGGDILNAGLAYTGDGWRYTRDRHANLAANGDLAFARARDYLRRYAARNGKGWYCVLIVADAGSLRETTRLELDRARLRRARGGRLRGRVRAGAAALRSWLEGPRGV